MILAYEDQEDKNRSKKKRETFEKHLRDQGLELETELKTVKVETLNANLKCCITFAIH